MSKSTRNAAFRKIDVDQYNEENYEEEQLADDGSAGPNIAEVQSLLAKFVSNVSCFLHFFTTKIIINIL